MQDIEHARVTFIQLTVCTVYYSTGWGCPEKLVRIRQLQVQSCVRQGQKRQAAC